jgi:hypothetical protein
MVADRRDCLLAKYRWAQLKLELGLDVPELDDLVQQVADFKTVCAALMSAAPTSSTERRAA